MACLRLASPGNRQWGSEETFAGEGNTCERESEEAGLSRVRIFFFFIFNIYVFIWLCWVFIATCGIFSPGCGTQDVFSCGIQTSGNMWDWVPWPGIKPGPPVLGAQSPSHWTTREDPGSDSFFFLASKQLSLLFAQGQLLQALRPQDFQKGWGRGVSRPASQVLPAPSCFLQEMGE